MKHFAQGLALLLSEVNRPANAPRIGERGVHLPASAPIGYPLVHEGAWKLAANPDGTFALVPPWEQPRAG